MGTQFFFHAMGTRAYSVPETKASGSLDLRIPVLGACGQILPQGRKGQEISEPDRVEER